MVSVEGRADLGDAPAGLVEGQRAWLVLDAPHRPLRLGVPLEAGAEGAMGIGDPGSPGLVVYLFRGIGTRPGPREPRDVFETGPAPPRTRGVHTAARDLVGHE